jgi:hypothetical protein
MHIAFSSQAFTVQQMKHRFSTYTGAKRAAANVERRLATARAIMEETLADSTCPASVKRALRANARTNEQNIVLPFLAQLKTLLKRNKANGT